MSTPTDPQQNTPWRWRLLLLWLVGAVLGECCGQAFGDVTDRTSLNPVPIEEEEADLRRLLIVNDDAWIMHELARVVWRAGRVEEARGLWDRAAKREPNLPSAVVAMSIELADKGRLTAARDALRRAALDDSDDPHLHLALGNLSVREGDLETAEKKFLKADQANPVLMATKIWLGRYYSTRGMLEQAERSFRSAISAKPSRPEAWLLLGSLQFSQNRVPEALESLRRADALDLFDRTAEERLGSLYLQRNDLVGARKWYGAALELAPESLRLRLAMATVEIRLDRPEQAELLLIQMPEIAKNAAALNLLAQTKEIQEQSLDAKSVYLQILQLDPKNVVANNNLAMIMIRLDEEPGEALEYAKAAVQAAPNNPATLSTYATALVLAQQSDRAERILPKIIDLLPTDPWLRYAYGKVLHQRGKSEEASYQLEGCLLLDRNFLRRDKVSELLRSLGKKE